MVETEKNLRDPCLERKHFCDGYLSIFDVELVRNDLYASVGARSLGEQ